MERPSLENRACIKILLIRLPTVTDDEFRFYARELQCAADAAAQGQMRVYHSREPRRDSPFKFFQKSNFPLRLKFVTPFELGMVEYPSVDETLAELARLQEDYGQKIKEGSPPRRPSKHKDDGHAATRKSPLMLPHSDLLISGGYALSWCDPARAMLAKEMQARVEDVCRSFSEVKNALESKELQNEFTDAPFPNSINDNALDEDPTGASHIVTLINTHNDTFNPYNKIVGVVCLGTQNPNEARSDGSGSSNSEDFTHSEDQMALIRDARISSTRIQNISNHYMRYLNIKQVLFRPGLGLPFQAPRTLEHAYSDPAQSLPLPPPPLPPPPAHMLSLSSDSSLHAGLPVALRTYLTGLFQAIDTPAQVTPSRFSQTPEASPINSSPVSPLAEPRITCMDVPLKYRLLLILTPPPNELHPSRVEPMVDPELPELATIPGLPTLGGRPLLDENEKADKEAPQGSRLATLRVHLHMFLGDLEHELFEAIEAGVLDIQKWLSAGVASSSPSSMPSQPSVTPVRSPSSSVASTPAPTPATPASSLLLRTASDREIERMGAPSVFRMNSSSLKVDPRASPTILMNLITSHSDLILGSIRTRGTLLGMPANIFEQGFGRVSRSDSKPLMMRSRSTACERIPILSSWIIADDEANSQTRQAEDDRSGETGHRAEIGSPSKPYPIALTMRFLLSLERLMHLIVELPPSLSALVLAPAVSSPIYHDALFTSGTILHKISALMRHADTRQTVHKTLLHMFTEDALDTKYLDHLLCSPGLSVPMKPEQGLLQPEPGPNEWNPVFVDVLGDTLAAFELPYLVVEQLIASSLHVRMLADVPCIPLERSLFDFFQEPPEAMSLQDERGADLDEGRQRLRYLRELCGVEVYSKVLPLQNVVEDDLFKPEVLPLQLSAFNVICDPSTRFAPHLAVRPRTTQESLILTRHSRTSLSPTRVAGEVLLGLCVRGPLSLHLDTDFSNDVMMLKQSILLRDLWQGDAHAITLHGQHGQAARRLAPVTPRLTTSTCPELAAARYLLNDFFLTLLQGMDPNLQTPSVPSTPSISEPLPLQLGLQPLKTTSERSLTTVTNALSLEALLTFDCRKTIAVVCALLAAIAPITEGSDSLRLVDISGYMGSHPVPQLVRGVSDSSIGHVEEPSIRPQPMEKSSSSNSLKSGSTRSKWMGRWNKIFGDWALLAGCPRDALTYYSRAADSLQLQVHSFGHHKHSDSLTSSEAQNIKERLQGTSAYSSHSGPVSPMGSEMGSRSNFDRVTATWLGAVWEGVAAAEASLAQEAYYRQERQRRAEQRRQSDFTITEVQDDDVDGDGAWVLPEWSPTPATTQSHIKPDESLVEDAHPNVATAESLGRMYEAMDLSHFDPWLTVSQRALMREVSCPASPKHALAATRPYFESVYAQRDILDVGYRSLVFHRIRSYFLSYFTSEHVSDSPHTSLSLLRSKFRQHRVVLSEVWRNQSTKNPVLSNVRRIIEAAKCMGTSGTHYKLAASFLLCMDAHQLSAAHESEVSPNASQTIPSSSKRPKNGVTFYIARQADSISSPLSSHKENCHWIKPAPIVPTSLMDVFLTIDRAGSQDDSLQTSLQEAVLKINTHSPVIIPPPVVPLQGSATTETVSVTSLISAIFIDPVAAIQQAVGVNMTLSSATPSRFAASLGISGPIGSLFGENDSGHSPSHSSQSGSVHPEQTALGVTASSAVASLAQLGTNVPSLIGDSSLAASYGNSGTTQTDVEPLAPPNVVASSIVQGLVGAIAYYGAAGAYMLQREALLTLSEHIFSAGAASAFLVLVRAAASAFTGKNAAGARDMLALVFELAVLSASHGLLRQAQAFLLYVAVLYHELHQDAASRAILLLLLEIGSNHFANLCLVLPPCGRVGPVVLNDCLADVCSRTSTTLMLPTHSLYPPSALAFFDPYDRSMIMKELNDICATLSHANLTSRDPRSFYELVVRVTSFARRFKQLAISSVPCELFARGSLAEKFKSHPILPLNQAMLTFALMSLFKAAQTMFISALTAYNSLANLINTQLAKQDLSTKEVGHIDGFATERKSSSIGVSAKHQEQLRASYDFLMHSRSQYFTTVAGVLRCLLVEQAPDSLQRYVLQAMNAALSLQLKLPNDPFDPPTQPAAAMASNSQHGEIQHSWMLGLPFVLGVRTLAFVHDLTIQEPFTVCTLDTQHQVCPHAPAHHIIGAIQALDEAISKWTSTRTQLNTSCECIQQLTPYDALALLHERLDIAVRVLQTNDARGYDSSWNMGSIPTPISEQARFEAKDKGLSSIVACDPQVAAQVSQLAKTGKMYTPWFSSSPAERHTERDYQGEDSFMACSLSPDITQSSSLTAPMEDAEGDLSQMLSPSRATANDPKFVPEFSVLEDSIGSKAARTSLNLNEVELPEAIPHPINIQPSQHEHHAKVSSTGVDARNPAEGQQPHRSQGKSDIGRSQYACPGCGRHLSNKPLMKGVQLIHYVKATPSLGTAEPTNCDTVPLRDDNPCRSLDLHSHAYLERSSPVTQNQFEPASDSPHNDDCAGHELPSGDAEDDGQEELFNPFDTPLDTATQSVSNMPVNKPAFDPAGSDSCPLHTDQRVAHLQTRRIHVNNACGCESKSADPSSDAQLGIKDLHLYVNGALMESTEDLLRGIYGALDELSAISNHHQRNAGPPVERLLQISQTLESLLIDANANEKCADRPKDGDQELTTMQVAARIHSQAWQQFAERTGRQQASAEASDEMSPRIITSRIPMDSVFDIEVWVANPYPEAICVSGITPKFRFAPATVNSGICVSDDTVSFTPNDRETSGRRVILAPYEGPMPIVLTGRLGLSRVLKSKLLEHGELKLQLCGIAMQLQSTNGAVAAFAANSLASEDQRELSLVPHLPPVQFVHPITATGCGIVLLPPHVMTKLSSPRGAKCPFPITGTPANARFPSTLPLDIVRFGGGQCDSIHPAHLGPTSTSSGLTLTILPPTPKVALSYGGATSATLLKMSASKMHPEGGSELKKALLRPFMLANAENLSTEPNSPSLALGESTVLRLVLQSPESTGLAAMRIRVDHVYERMSYEGEGSSPYSLRSSDAEVAYELPDGPFGAMTSLSRLRIDDQTSALLESVYQLDGLTSPWADVPILAYRKPPLIIQSADRSSVRSSVPGDDCIASVSAAAALDLETLATQLPLLQNNERNSVGLLASQRKHAVQSIIQRLSTTPVSQQTLGSVIHEMSDSSPTLPSLIKSLHTLLDERFRVTYGQSIVAHGARMSHGSKLGSLPIGSLVMHSGELRRLIPLACTWEVPGQYADILAPISSSGTLNMSAEPGTVIIDSVSLRELLPIGAGKALCIPVLIAKPPPSVVNVRRLGFVAGGVEQVESYKHIAVRVSVLTSDLAVPPTNESGMSHAPDQLRHPCESVRSAISVLYIPVARCLDGDRRSCQPLRLNEMGQVSLWMRNPISRPVRILTPPFLRLSERPCGRRRMHARFVTSGLVHSFHLPSPRPTSDGSIQYEPSVSRLSASSASNAASELQTTNALSVYSAIFGASLMTDHPVTVSYQYSTSMESLGISANSPAHEIELKPGECRELSFQLPPLELPPEVRVSILCLLHRLYRLKFSQGPLRVPTLEDLVEAARWSELVIEPTEEICRICDMSPDQARLCAQQVSRELISFPLASRSLRALGAALWTRMLTPFTWLEKSEADKMTMRSAMALRSGHFVLPQRLAPGAAAICSDLVPLTIGHLSDFSFMFDVSRNPASELYDSDDESDPPETSCSDEDYGGSSESSVRHKRVWMKVGDEIRVTLRVTNRFPLPMTFAALIIPRFKDDQLECSKVSSLPQLESAYQTCVARQSTFADVAIICGQLASSATVLLPGEILNLTFSACVVEPAVIAFEALIYASTSHTQVVLTRESMNQAETTSQQPQAPQSTVQSLNVLERQALERENEELQKLGFSPISDVTLPSTPEFTLGWRVPEGELLTVHVEIPEDACELGQLKQSAEAAWSLADLSRMGGGPGDPNIGAYYETLSHTNED